MNTGFNVSTYSIAAFCVIFFGYILQTSVLQYFFYYRRKAPKDIHAWKIQPSKRNAVGCFWFMPVMSKKPNRGPYHAVLSSCNLLIASMFAFVTTECSVRSYNQMMFENIEDVGLMSIVAGFMLAVAYENIAEYYWHRMMHTKHFYATFHKIHHYYKSPEPWDDMYIHPLEAIGYYFILYGPPFLFPIHYVSFIGYMIVMGLCGVLDHSGVHFEVPGLYDTVDHDNHHLKFEVNYSFPFPYMDILHGTYDGVFLGKTYSCRSSSGKNSL